MSLATYTFRRRLLVIPTLIGVSLLTFVLSHLVPGNPARLAAGAQATPEIYEQIRREFGLDKPLPVQYRTYVSDLVGGDWGRSILSRRPVLDDLRVYWPATLELVVASMAIAVAIGVPLGIVAAVRSDRFADQASRVIALLGVSVPAFWLALLLQLAFGLPLDWLPVSGRLDPMATAPENVTGLYVVDRLVAGEWGSVRDGLLHLVLPALTLSFPALATIARFTRPSLLEVLGNDYVRTARAKGLIEQRVVLGHALRNAFIPTLTMIGLSFGWAMGGSVLAETVYDWPGIRLYATKSALALDFMPIMRIALHYGIVFSLINSINIAVDLAYGFLDPGSSPLGFAAALGPSLLNVMIAVSLVWWPGYCRLVRANFVALHDSQFADTARSLGGGRRRVLFRHVLPNAFPTVLVKASMDVGLAVLSTAALGFIGLGTQPPIPDWGVMIADGRKYLREAWRYSTFPGVAIRLLVLACNLFGDGLRDVFDPRARRA